MSASHTHPVYPMYVVYLGSTLRYITYTLYTPKSGWPA
jgi:hypothetical protein